MKQFIEGPVGNLEIEHEFQPGHLPIIGIVCHPHPLFGGTMTNKVVTTVAKAFHHLNISTILFNYRGVGKSEGSYGHMAGEIEDLKAVATWAKSHHPHHEFWLAGFSFGAYIAANGAILLDAKQLITIAPAVNHADFSDLKLKCPWLVIQGEEDEIVPPDEVYRVINAISPPPTLIKIPHAGHFFHHKLNELFEAIINYTHRT